jgi:hypothetical protein
MAEVGVSVANQDRRVQPLTHEGKREVRVYDYADLNVPMLARMFDRRCRGYKSLGYTMLLPASAVPGWPVEVPLPIDPEWKRDYAGGLFCADSRVVIELDGAQHLADAEAYRRDRRKDAMLQKNGYFVLRFLAEDAGNVN